MFAQERYARYGQMIEQVMAQQATAGEQLIAFAIAINEPPVNKKTAITGTLLAGGPGLEMAMAAKYTAYLIAATSTRVLFIGLSPMSNYKIENYQSLPFSSIQILKVKRKLFGLEKKAILATPIGQFWLMYTPKMLVGRLDPVLDFIRKQQTMAVPVNQFKSTPMGNAADTSQSAASSLTNENQK